jgi:methyl-accepting chemotaxis protein
MSGETDYIPLSVGDKDLYVFYKPFKQAVVPNRAIEELGWTIAVAVPKDDIYGEFNRLFNYAIIIGIAGMLLLFLSCWAILYLRLRPLKMLTGKAERIAQGHYNEPIPNTWSRDEIGSLQRNFIRMRRALAAHIGELEQLTKTIQERSEELKTAYKQAKKVEKLKTAFLHHVTNQMLAPAQAIDEDVKVLSDIGNKAGQVDGTQLVEHLQQNGNTITQLLNQMLNQSEEDMRKEVEHD